LLSKIKLLKKNNIVDLNSGIGITSILLAKNGYQVTGVEISPKAVALAKKNAEKNQTLVEFIALAAEATIDQVLDLKNPKVVILNPPRVGAKPEVLRALLKKKPEHIFYISCMPPTLARDLKILTEEYKIISCKAYDMFPHTTHVETLVHLAIGKIII
jgi:23S rRNA (uracil1939-C5)-methyltransferase